MRNRQRKTQTNLVRFWSLVKKSDDGCWEWLGRKNEKGYGVYSTNPKIRAHRLVFELTNNVQVSRSLEVMHICDNRSCVRPDHLRLGTHKENMEDMAKKGRAHRFLGDEHWTKKQPGRYRGSNNPASKLTEADIVEIRKSRLDYKIIATRYGLSRTHAHHIVNNKCWAHVQVD